MPEQKQGNRREVELKWQSHAQDSLVPLQIYINGFEHFSLLTHLIEKVIMIVIFHVPYICRSIRLFWSLFWLKLMEGSFCFTFYQICFAKCLRNNKTNFYSGIILLVILLKEINVCYHSRHATRNFLGQERFCGVKTLW